MHIKLLKTSIFLHSGPECKRPYFKHSLSHNVRSFNSSERDVKVKNIVCTMLTHSETKEGKDRDINVV